MRPPMDRPAHAVRAPAFSTRIPPLASSVSKAGGASTSSAKDSRSTVLVLPPRSAAYYAQHAIPHSRKGKAAVKEPAAPSSEAPYSSTLPEPEQRDLVVSAPAAAVQTPSQRRLSVGIDYTDRFILPDSPDHPEACGTVTYNGRLISLDEDLDMIGSEYELHDTLEDKALDELELMEIEALMETPSETEPEQGGTITPAPEADLEEIHMASASPALTN
jgi:hypothetical protein